VARQDPAAARRTTRGTITSCFIGRPRFGLSLTSIDAGHGYWYHYGYRCVKSLWRRLSCHRSSLVMGVCAWICRCLNQAKSEPIAGSPGMDPGCSLKLRSPQQNSLPGRGVVSSCGPNEAFLQDPVILLMQTNELGATCSSNNHCLHSAELIRPKALDFRL